MQGEDERGWLEQQNEKKYTDIRVSDTTTHCRGKKLIRCFFSLFFPFLLPHYSPANLVQRVVSEKEEEEVTEGPTVQRFGNREEDRRPVDHSVCVCDAHNVSDWEANSLTHSLIRTTGHTTGRIELAGKRKRTEWVKKIDTQKNWDPSDSGVCLSSHRFPCGLWSIIQYLFHSERVSSVGVCVEPVIAIRKKGKKNVLQHKRVTHTHWDHHLLPSFFLLIDQAFDSVCESDYECMKRNTDSDESWGQVTRLKKEKEKILFCLRVFDKKHTLTDARNTIASLSVFQNHRQHIQLWLVRCGDKESGFWDELSLESWKPFPHRFSGFVLL